MSEPFPHRELSTEQGLLTEKSVSPSMWLVFDTFLYLLFLEICYETWIHLTTTEGIKKLKTHTLALTHFSSETFPLSCRCRYPIRGINSCWTLSSLRGSFLHFSGRMFSRFRLRHNLQSTESQVSHTTSPLYRPIARMSQRKAQDHHPAMLVKRAIRMTGHQ